jgi:hypothetical protein
MTGADVPSVTFTPQAEPQDRVTFDQFRKFSIAEVGRRFAALDEPGADVPPFLTVAGPSVLGVLDWTWTSEGFLPEFDELIGRVPDAIAAQGKKTYLTMAGLVATTYLHPPSDEVHHPQGDSNRIESVILALLSIEGAGDRLTLGAKIERTDSSPPELADFERLENNVPANIGEPIARGLELGIPDSDDFTAFVNEDLPEYLAYAIGALGDDWNGSPLFVLAIPERDDLDGNVLTGESASDRVREMYSVIRRGDLPVAGAYVASAPMVTPVGPVAKEAILFISCADAEGRQSDTAKRLYVDEAGVTQIGELPDDVQPSRMPSEIVRFLVAIMGVAGLDRAGLLPLGEENWTLLLAGTLDRLDSGTG